MPIAQPLIWLTMDDCGSYEWFFDRGHALAQRDRLRVPIPAPKGAHPRRTVRPQAETYEFPAAKLGPNDYCNPPWSKATKLP